MHVCSRNPCFRLCFEKIRKALSVRDFSAMLKFHFRSLLISAWPMIASAMKSNLHAGIFFKVTQSIYSISKNGLPDFVKTHICQIYIFGQKHLWGKKEYARGETSEAMYNFIFIIISTVHMDNISSCNFIKFEPVPILEI